MNDTRGRLSLGGRAPWWLWLCAWGVALGVFFPTLYTFIQASEVPSFSHLVGLLFRARMGYLVLRSVLLLASVLLCSLLIAVPLAWLTTRTDMKGRAVGVLFGVLPLALPTYMMSYAYLSMGGDMGFLKSILGISMQRIHGYWGALWVLTLCNIPYLYLNLRTAFSNTDPSLEESAQALGYTHWQIFRLVILPQCWPAIWAGGLLVSLHVLGNFEAVSLMRYKTLSWELFQYRLLDRPYSAWLSLILLGLTVVILWVEAGYLRSFRVARAGRGTQRQQRTLALGPWRWVSYVFLAVYGFFAVILPVGVVLYWSFDASGVSIWSKEWSGIIDAAVCSLQSSGPAALIAMLFGVPLVYLSSRYSTWMTRMLERISYFGYSIPPVTLALGLVFFSLKWAYFLHLSLTLLVVALVLRFLAEALGPVRSALHRLSPRLEESSFALGHGHWSTFWRVILPNVYSGMFSGAVLVFLSSLKELSLNLIISPTGYSSLAMEVWDNVENAQYAEASPYALCILFFSLSFVVCLLFFYDEKHT
ncbi:MAG: iron ABC transporter permease [Deltaproteobacteria bacterium]|nr:iron ABC transporter permease [Deltaproteobacteria bacterium]MBU51656.1 iron ABC transporter permease [Deltaproteobacteria bacterium]|tara:strand:- start:628 stop:2223 length:1596 start_codon:yes stop_codon:yes gene_type:complete